MGGVVHERGDQIPIQVLEPNHDQIGVHGDGSDRGMAISVQETVRLSPTNPGIAGATRGLDYDVQKLPFEGVHIAQGSVVLAYAFTLRTGQLQDRAVVGMGRDEQDLIDAYPFLHGLSNPVGQGFGGCPSQVQPYDGEFCIAYLNGDGFRM
ncbi:MAG: hypothetical protein AMXMBFR82_46870 [Candidatus Hydrogenedentota bacterium]